MLDLPQNQEPSRNTPVSSQQPLLESGMQHVAFLGVHTLTKIIQQLFKLANTSAFQPVIDESRRNAFEEIRRDFVQTWDIAEASIKALMLTKAGATIEEEVARVLQTEMMVWNRLIQEARELELGILESFEERIDGTDRFAIEVEGSLSLLQNGENKNLYQFNLAKSYRIDSDQRFLWIRSFLHALTSTYQNNPFTPVHETAAELALAEIAPSSKARTAGFDIRPLLYALCNDSKEIQSPQNSQLIFADQESTQALVFSCFSFLQRLRHSQANMLRGESLENAVPSSTTAEGRTDLRLSRSIAANDIEKTPIFQNWDGEGELRFTLPISKYQAIDLYKKQITEWLIGMQPLATSLGISFALEEEAQALTLVIMLFTADKTSEEQDQYQADLVEAYDFNTTSLNTTHLETPVFFKARTTNESLHDSPYEICCLQPWLLTSANIGTLKTAIGLGERIIQFTSFTRLRVHSLSPLPNELNSLSEFDYRITLESPSTDAWREVLTKKLQLPWEKAPFNIPQETQSVVEEQLSLDASLFMGSDAHDNMNLLAELLSYAECRSIVAFVVSSIPSEWDPIVYTRNCLSAYVSVFQKCRDAYPDTKLYFSIKEVDQGRRQASTSLKHCILEIYDDNDTIIGGTVVHVRPPDHPVPFYTETKIVDAAFIDKQAKRIFTKFSAVLEYTTQFTDPLVLYEARREDNIFLTTTVLQNLAECFGKLELELSYEEEEQEEKLSRTIFDILRTLLRRPELQVLEVMPEFNGDGNTLSFAPLPALVVEDAFDTLPHNWPKLRVSQLPRKS